jgi:hypothetical protein
MSHSQIGNVRSLLDDIQRAVDKRGDPQHAVPTNELPAPCRRCRRPLALCICASHVHIDDAQLAPRDLSQEIEVAHLMMRVGPPLDSHAVEARVTEAMRHYYARDPAGLERLIRGWFE